MVIGRPAVAPMRRHAKVRAKSAARRLENAAMERRPARASSPRGPHACQGVDDVCADGRSVPFGLAEGRKEDRKTGGPDA